MQSETQRNLLLCILFNNLRVRYFSLDRQLRGSLKPFEVLHQTISMLGVKKPLVLCAGSHSTTIQDHPGVVCFALLCSTTAPEIVFKAQPEGALVPP